MKNLRYLWILIIINLYPGIISMETMKISADQAAKFNKNIWTFMLQYLIDPSGKTADEIFKVTDIIMYPKKQSQNTVNKDIDTEKIKIKNI